MLSCSAANMTYVTFIYYSYEAPLALLFSKIAPIFLALWSLLISFYVIVITNEYDKKKYNFLIKNHRKIMLGIYIFTFIVSIVISCFKIFDSFCIYSSKVNFFSIISPLKLKLVALIISQMFETSIFTYTFRIILFQNFFIFF